MTRPDAVAAAPDACAADCPFATSVPRADALDRRTFLSRAALAAAAAALAACGVDSPTAPATLSSATTFSLSDYPALANVGGVALVRAGGASLALVRTGASSFAALSRVCPHEGGTIDPTGSGFTCEKHGARFALDGTWTGGQRTSSMRSYPTSYDAAAGTVTVG